MLPPPELRQSRSLNRPSPTTNGCWAPTTLTMRNNLAAAFLDAGRTAEAIPLLEQTLANHEQVLGVGHPNTKVVRENLAALTGETEHSNGE
jgi:Tetratricopeptide repeat